MSAIQATLRRPPQKIWAGTRCVSIGRLRDSSHWRVNTRIVEPVLERDHQVIVADGPRVVWYRDDTNTASRYRLPPPLRALALTTFQVGFGPLTGETIEQYVQELSNASSGTRAKLVGQSVMLGRKTDVLDIWPAVRTSKGPCRGETQCLKHSRGFGRAQLSIDDQTGLLLRYQVSGVPAAEGDDVLFRFTSISLGGGSDKDRAFLHTSGQADQIAVIPSGQAALVGNCRQRNFQPGTRFNLDCAQGFHSSRRANGRAGRRNSTSRVWPERGAVGRYRFHRRDL